MLRFGLCCIFRDEPIKFCTTTAAAMSRLDRPAALARISSLCLANARSLLEALRFCACKGIGSFRIQSQILPLKTHPTCGYDVRDLPDSAAIIEAFQACGTFAQENNVRTTFHPDQFVVLNSQRPDVVDASLREIEYQAEVAGWVGADVLNIHVGGAFGDKKKALEDFAKGYARLSAEARRRITLENDDRTFTPEDLLPFCKNMGIPLVYDVHHHRCNPDALSIEEATRGALETWNREPLFHISSPLDGWKGPFPQRHHDFIQLRDFPAFWLDLDITVEIEAKAKEVAILKLMRALKRRASIKNTIVLP